MCTRFPMPPQKPPEGTRGPSKQRLTQSAASLRQGALSNSLNRHRRAYSKSDARMEENTDAESQGGPAKMCYVCGAPTVESGNGLRACPECHSIQLKSGFMSRSHTIANAALDLVAAKKLFDPDAPEIVEDVDLNPRACRAAWTRMSTNVHAEMTHAMGTVPVDNVCGLEEEHTPIMAGFVNTGYCKGDRVKTPLRLAGACPGAGWDPINHETGQGTVQGPGRKDGEIMVKFDYNNLTCSMKMGQLEHVHIHAPATHLQRSMCRKSHVSHFH